MTDVLPWVGGILTALAALLGAYAAFKAKQVDNKTATREETQQALDAQGALLDRYENRIALLETQIVEINNKAEDAISARNEATIHHKRCEATLRFTHNRLRLAEARIAELGG